MAVTNLAERLEIYRTDEEIQNQQKGEIKKVPNKVKSGQKYFLMMFPEEYSKVMRSLNGTEFLVLDYLVSNINKKMGLVHKTYDQIAKGANVSTRTVARAVVKLKKVGFMSYLKDGEWAINPYVVVYGGYGAQPRWYSQYIEGKR